MLYATYVYVMQLYITTRSIYVGNTWFIDCVHVVGRVIIEQVSMYRQSFSSHKLISLVPLQVLQSSWR